MSPRDLLEGTLWGGVGNTLKHILTGESIAKDAQLLLMKTCKASQQQFKFCGATEPKHFDKEPTRTEVDSSLVVFFIQRKHFLYLENWMDCNICKHSFIIMISHNQVLIGTEPERGQVLKVRQPVLLVKSRSVCLGWGEKPASGDTGMNIRNMNPLEKI